MNDPISPGVANPIHEAIFAGRKIEAIKLHRKETGSDLKGAKEAVEQLERELRVSFPDRFSAEKSAKGCLSVITILGLAGIAFWRLLA